MGLDSTMPSSTRNFVKKSMTTTWLGHAPAGHNESLCKPIEELTADRASRGTYSAQWVMVHSVARHLGVSEAGADAAVAEALTRRRITLPATLPHSVSLIAVGAKSTITPHLNGHGLPPW